MPFPFPADGSRRAALTTALAYVLIAGVWIALSDTAVILLADDPNTTRTLQTAKDWGFILVTGVALYWILLRQLQRFQDQATPVRSLLDRIPGVVYRLRWGASPEVAFVSPSVQELSGYQAERFTADPRFFLEIMHPEDRERVERFLDHPSESNWPREVRIRRRDGGVRWLENLGSLLPEEDGSGGWIVGIIQDVTERRESERIRRLLEAAVTAAQEAVIITDSEGQIEYVNPAFERMTGYCQEDAVGGTPRILKSGKQGPAFYRRMWRKLQSGAPFQAEFVNRRKDSSLYRQETTITPVLGGDGRPEHFVAVARDITREKQMRKQLREAQKAEILGHVAGGIAHDCRNTLGVIQAHAELARQALDEGSSPNAELQEIVGAVQEGSRLLRGLLRLGGKGELNRVRTSLPELMKGIRPTLRATLPETVALEVEVESGKDLHAMVDPGSVYQMVLNLATNARDAMPAGGRLAVRLTRSEADSPEGTVGREEWIVLEVTDSGYGMAPETLARVFEPLFTTKAAAGGTGLGMTMVARLMEDHGGWVDVESTPGEGTTVRLLFPPADQSGQNASHPQKAGASSSGLDTGKPSGAGGPLPAGDEAILVVEDEEPLRRAMVRSLEKLGYRILTASTGKEALDLLAEESVDLVITDLVMPEMGGRELYEELSLLGLRDLPVIFMSGYNLEELGAPLPFDAEQGFLEKPWTLRQLATKVRGALDSSPARRG